MEIVQVLIFMVIIAIAIVQQITKAKKETGTPSPREVLTDMFPTIEETEEEEQTISPRPIKCTPRPIRKKKEKPLSAPIANGPLFTRKFSIENINNNNTNNQKTH